MDQKSGILESLAAYDASKSASTNSIERLGNYRLTKKLGEGGMGAVFLAEDIIAQRTVALKVLPLDKADHPHAVSRFRREAKALGKLNHPNIIQAYALGEENGVHFYAMERCDGKPLDVILQERRRLSVAESLDYITQAARGLEHAHAHGILHRDIKPGNLFVTTDGVVKILDLGLSKHIDTELEQSFVTGAGTVLGTPYYISPEQAVGKMEIDGRTDIYSLGATLYHLATGRTPFDGPSAAVIVSKHLIEKLPNPRDLNPEIPESLVRVIERMMAKAPEDRYASCGELLDDLEAIASGAALSSPALEADLTSILPRSAVLNAAQPSNAAQELSLGERLHKLSFGAKVVGVCGACAMFLLLVLVVRAMLFSGSAHAVKAEPTASAQPPLLKMSDESVPQWTKVADAAPLPPPLPQTPGAAAGAKPAKSSETPAPVLSGLKKAVTFIPSDKDGWKNVLHTIDPVQRYQGRWKFENNVLIAEPGGDARIGVPYDLPREYDVRIDFRQTNGEFGILLPCNGKPAVWMLSSRSRGCIIGCPLSGRPRWTELRGFDFAGKHAAKFEVRSDGVRVFLDDLHEPLLEWKLPTGASEPRAFPWVNVDQSELGLSSRHGSAAIYTLQLRDKL